MPFKFPCNKFVILHVLASPASEFSVNTHANIKFQCIYLTRDQLTEAP